MHFVLRRYIPIAPVLRNHVVDWPIAFSLLVHHPPFSQRTPCSLPRELPLLLFAFVRLACAKLLHFSFYILRLLPPVGSSRSTDQGTKAANEGKNRDRSNREQDSKCCAISQSCVATTTRVSGTTRHNWTHAGHPPTEGCFNRNCAVTNRNQK